VRRVSETGILAIDLANTCEPELDDPERLPDARALRGFLAEHDIDASPTRRDLDRCRVLRERLIHLFDAPSADELVARLNAMISEVSTGAALVGENESGWALALTSRPRCRLDERLAVVAVNELVDLVSTIGPERIRTCEAGPCCEIFVDTSRNGRRLYCSRRCANRLNATRHRHRNAPRTRQSRRRARGGRFDTQHD
jgi:predicted RNA-binding Zn ribbon-like protein